MTPQEPAGETLAKALDLLHQVEDEGGTVATVAVLMAVSLPPSEGHPTGQTSYTATWTPGTAPHESLGLLRFHLIREEREAAE